MPGIASSSARKSVSGANPASSQAPKSPAGNAVETLKSRQPPHTVRWTLPLAFIAGKCFSSTFCAAARDALSSSALHLHRHSRATVSKVTPSAAIVGKTRARGQSLASPSSKRPSSKRPSSRRSSRTDCDLSHRSDRRGASGGAGACGGESGELGRELRAKSHQTSRTRVRGVSTRGR